MSAQTNAPSTTVAERFREVRRRTMALCEPLTPEDMMVQSCPEASPAKWHLAHTAWFFESFVLREFVPGYQPFHPDFVWLFNSYYQTFAAFPEKRLRSSFSRPGLEEILRFRAHVDEAVEQLLDQSPEPEVLKRIELGANHEEQHQELLLTDILHAFFTNPLRPAYRKLEAPLRAAGSAAPLQFLRFEGGLLEAGHAGETFCFDNELPRHRVWLEPYGLAERLVTCGEYAEFIEDGGYRRPELWLSDGWNAVQAHGWNAPLYWSSGSGEWTVFTLRGEIPLTQMKNASVSQVSFYEAEAYARWAGYRLPTEFEWEAAAEGRLITGNLLDSGTLMTMPASELVEQEVLRKPPRGKVLVPEAPVPFQRPWQLFGDCWQWTASAYLGYPGFRPLPGSLGEYNGKFMSGQMVLRGGSCITPTAHIRSSYRNFFAPDIRWQFSGIRLAS
ncbi:ergothioneine biosynthesis protein EgtB [Occallatibacter riparius]|uniref:Ergothioneine biosynthesis protein EgtB n=1 Tax=Occallatibacter riparius TaxID=1002689 RepID=A0A9J7BXI7_9BACT|nr:ergothioneine biosynthesis protein EgtB [Occallatibacter riparius]UWZ85710.1 ergothioneine biosynthesis protein EgtB [Occallatibacter riparius]